MNAVLVVHEGHRTDVLVHLLLLIGGSNNVESSWLTRSFQF